MEITLNLGGRPITVNWSDEDDELYVFGLAQKVNEKIAEIQQKMQIQDTQQVALLVALHFAEELARTKGKYKRDEDKTKAKVKELTHLLSEELVENV